MKICDNRIDSEIRKTQCNETQIQVKGNNYTDTQSPTGKHCRSTPNEHPPTVGVSVQGMRDKNCSKLTDFFFSYILSTTKNQEEERERRREKGKREADFYMAELWICAVAKITVQTIIFIGRMAPPNRRMAVGVDKWAAVKNNARMEHGMQSRG